jgi:hypothetical protein
VFIILTDANKVLGRTNLDHIIAYRPATDLGDGCNSSVTFSPGFTLRVRETVGEIDALVGDVRKISFFPSDEL